MTTGEEGGHHEDHTEAQGLGNVHQLGVQQVGLAGHENDGPDILQDQDSYGQAAGNGVYLELIVQKLHDDEGGA